MDKNRIRAAAEKLKGNVKAKIGSVAGSIEGKTRGGFSRAVGSVRAAVDKRTNTKGAPPATEAPPKSNSK